MRKKKKTSAENIYSSLHRVRFTTFIPSDNRDDDDDVSMDGKQVTRKSGSSCISATNMEKKLHRGIIAREGDAFVFHYNKIAIECNKVAEVLDCRVLPLLSEMHR
ncbi:unnamed protein product [Hermetia illucens]|uniref:Uncharacterized protein n=1 Tax=Hermetia illucens TaxID=343691 RepID=A0A7R8UMN7_HERIL|nr:unnamed protein product [Hermetia illucens]